MLRTAAARLRRAYTTAAVTPLEKEWLDWSAKQARILTGGGKAVAERHYTAKNGYAFEESELPHHHLVRGDTHDAFARFKRADDNFRETVLSGPARNADGELVWDWVCGAWGRSIFVGGWEHTNYASENCYNLQTPSIFVDIRIPTARQHADYAGLEGATGFGELSEAQLRLLARQHAFCGYSRIARSTLRAHAWQPVCARHHAIDWNFVGAPRSRPNKWRLEPDLANATAEGGVQRWKEWSYAADAAGQAYYMEQWERLADGGGGPYLALRACSQSEGADTVVVVVGDHFNYIRARPVHWSAFEGYGASAAEVIDEALRRGERSLAEACLSLYAGHGRVRAGWSVDASLQPWHQQWRLDEVLGGWFVVQGDAKSAPTHVQLEQPTAAGHASAQLFDVLECSFATVAELASYLRSCGPV